MKLSNKRESLSSFHDKDMLVCDSVNVYLWFTLEGYVFMTALHRQLGPDVIMLHSSKTTRVYG